MTAMRLVQVIADVITLPAERPSLYQACELVVVMRGAVGSGFHADLEAAKNLVVQCGGKQHDRCYAETARLAKPMDRLRVADQIQAIPILALYKQLNGALSPDHVGLASEIQMGFKFDRPK